MTIVYILPPVMLLNYVFIGLPYSRKVWWVESLVNLLFSSVWQKKVWQMNRLAKGLLLVWMILVWQIADDLPNL